MNRIEQLSSTDRHGKWIPVSERLPEIEGKYLVTFCAYEKEIKGETVVIGDKNKSVAEVGFGCSQKDFLGYPIGFGWYDLGTADYYDKESIVAWQPLPEPYVEGGRTMIREYIYFVDDNPNGTSGMTEEEIIRCGDCKHYREYEPNAKHDGWCSLDRVTDVNKEDFCSKAERKEK